MNNNTTLRQSNAEEPARGKRILVVDDDKAQADLVARALSDEGFLVSTAYSGPDGVNLFRSATPDLVVMDFAMPGMNGFEAVQEMRRLEGGKRRALIVMVTAYSQAFLVSVDFQVGVDGYLTKPLVPSELVARVEELLLNSR